MTTMNITETANNIEATLTSLQQSGKFFSVTFTKKNGEERTFKGVRFNVKKHTKGGVSTTAHIPDLVTVWNEEEGYKCFSKNRVISIRANGEEIS